MVITFKKGQLQILVGDEVKLIAKLGPGCAKKLKRRLDDLASARCLEDLRNAPGKYALANEEKLQFSCDLGHPYLLIFESHEKPLPKDDNGQYNWNAIQGIAIIEVIKS